MRGEAGTDCVPTYLMFDVYPQRRQNASKRNETELNDRCLHVTSRDANPIPSTAASWILLQDDSHTVSDCSGSVQLPPIRTSVLQFYSEGIHSSK
jgi:hypothetical protein